MRTTRALFDGKQLYSERQGRFLIYRVDDAVLTALIEILSARGETSK